MSETAAIDLEPLERRDWRVWFGLGSTFFWLWLGYLYITSNVGWAAFAKQPADARRGRHPSAPRRRGAFSTSINAATTCGDVAHAGRAPG